MLGRMASLTTIIFKKIFRTDVGTPGNHAIRLWRCFLSQAVNQRGQLPNLEIWHENPSRKAKGDFFFLMGKIWGNHSSIYEIISNLLQIWNETCFTLCRNKRKSSGLDLLFNSQLRKSSSPARCHLIHRRCGKAGGNLTHIASRETSWEETLTSDSCPQKTLQKKKTVYFIFIDSYSMLCQLLIYIQMFMNW